MQSPVFGWMCKLKAKWKSCKTQVFLGSFNRKVEKAREIISWDWHVFITYRLCTCICTWKNEKCQRA